MQHYVQVIALAIPAETEIKNKKLLILVDRNPTIPIVSRHKHRKILHTYYQISHLKSLVSSQQSP